MSESLTPSPQEPVAPCENDGGLTDRRGFLTAAVGVVGACYAAAIGYPVYRYLASPVEQASLAVAVNEVTLPDALSLPKNAALMFKFGPKPAVLIHHEDDTWSALSAVCTHLGCTVGYQPDKKVIFCPCHSGVYNARTGANISGPPPKPLTEYQVSISDGQLTVKRS